MEERVEKWLYDIRFAIEEVESFLEEHKVVDFSGYRSHTILKRAVERDLEIIGEAVNRIIKREPGFIGRISQAKAIIGLRNEIIHAYDGISDENIWAVLINHLPKLKVEVENCLKIK